MRNENDLAEIREYIRNNQARWELDDVNFPLYGAVCKPPYFCQEPQGRLSDTARYAKSHEFPYVLSITQPVLNDSHHDLSRKQR